MKKTNKYNTLASNHEDYLPEYRVWTNMNRRCCNPASDMYETYGGRGIKVCERWADKEKGFINFYNDMGKRPVENNGRPYQIDRIDNNGNYCPENCRWVTAKANSYNRRSTRKTSLYEDEMSMGEVCKLLHLKRTTVSEAVRQGRANVEDAIVNAIKLKYKDKVCVL